MKGGWKRLTGLDLKIGGEGMKGIYDGILTGYTRRYGKKWGAAIGQTLLPQASEIVRLVEFGLGRRW